MLSFYKESIFLIITQESTVFYRVTNYRSFTRWNKSGIWLLIEDNFKTCSFDNSFERVDNGASVNVVNLVRYLPHPDSGCKSRELGFHQFQTVEGRKWQENRFLFFSTSRRWFRYFSPLYLFSSFFFIIFFSCDWIYSHRLFIINKQLDMPHFIIW